MRNRDAPPAPRESRAREAVIGHGKFDGLLDPKYGWMARPSRYVLHARPA